MEGGRDEKAVGHLLALLQLEWPSPPAELIMTHVLEDIRKRGSFCYFPFFSDYVIEADFIEEFMAIANHESKTVVLDLFGGASAGSG